MPFETTATDKIGYLTSSILTARGLKHGFIGATLNFALEDRESARRRFTEGFKVKSLALLKQVHGSQIVRISGEPGGIDSAEGDAFIIPDSFREKRHAAGILTADCIPIILLSGVKAGVVHCGWRGLAAGIIKKVIKELLSDNGSGELIAAIGPCAGSKTYEVGGEVIEEIGEGAVFQKLPSGKFLLALDETAEAMVYAEKSNALVERSEICVISDQNFHSYRRDGSNAGRNLSFVIF